MPVTVINADNTASTTNINNDTVITSTLSFTTAVTVADNLLVVNNGSIVGFGANNIGLSSTFDLDLINHGIIAGDTAIAFNRGLNVPFLSTTLQSITNYGVIQSDGAGHAAIEDNLSVNGASLKQEIYNTGQIIGQIGLDLGSKDSLTENGGFIRGTLGTAITTGENNDVVRNWGMIDGAVLLGDGSNKVENSGTITQAVSTGAGNDRLINTGTLNASVDLGAGFNFAANYELIGGSVVGGSSGDTFENHGTVGGSVSLGDGSNDVLNTGTIGSSISLGAVDDWLNNSGILLGNVFMGNGSNTFVNTGAVEGEVFFGTGDDFLSNGGSLIDDVLMGSGNDSYFTFESGFAAVVFGGAGNDTLRGGAGVDHFEGDADNDSLDGGGGDDSLFGGAGLDILIGGVGADALDGGTEVDAASYERAVSGVVASLADGEANTGEAAGDTYVSIEALTGSAFADRLTGDAGRNTLKGGAGSDRLAGGSEADSLEGGDGDDFLDGGAGRDTLSGLAGSDTYIVDNAADLIVETSATGGTDLVLARTGYVLHPGARIETIRADAGSTGLSLVGNGFAQRLEGNIGRDTLVGGGGADTILGGLGKDQLTGGANADKFVFSTVLGPANIDRITGFTHDLDIIQLDDAIFAAIGPSLGKAEFYAKAGATKAHDASDHIIYNPKTGWLYYDDDGKGGHAALHFATLATKPTLDHGDFVIV